MPPAGELSPTDSYVIPSWGGVIIHSPPPLAAGAAPGAQPSTTVLASAELEGTLWHLDGPHQVQCGAVQLHMCWDTCSHPQAIAKSFDST